MDNSIPQNLPNSTSRRRKSGFPIPHTCQLCGCTFLANKSAERTYCSKKCYWKSKERKNQRTCPTCGKTFECMPCVTTVYCSRICNGIAKREDEIRICVHCHQGFTVKPSSVQRHCGRDCAAKATSPNRKTAYPIRTCAKCGKEFEHKRHDTSGKYCSRTCSDSVDKNPPAKEWPIKICAHCGDTFSRHPSYQTTYCSSKCAKVHVAETMRGPNHPSWKGKVERACEVCGTICQVKPSLLSQFRVCSASCRGALSRIAQKNRTSSIEIKMQKAMQEDGLNPTHQYSIGPFTADFAFIEQRLVVECDGDYWHGTDKQKAKDRKRDGYFKHVGWHVLRLSETDINLSATDCVLRIQAKLQSLK